MKSLKNFFNLLGKKVKKDQTKKMRESEFVFDRVDLLHYNFHKISLNRGGSYIDFPEWIKNKKATINPRNNGDKCFQYALISHSITNKLKVIQKEYQKLKIFIDHYNWKEIFHHTKKTGKSLN